MKVQNKTCERELWAATEKKGGGGKYFSIQTHTETELTGRACSERLRH